jgi:spermidine/putrescine ABC transporter ATP-binding subunit
MKVGVRIESVTKRFGSVTAVDSVSVEVKPGTFMLLLGPSGCGKTTTLRLIAGFVRPNSGNIYIGDARVNDVPPYRRNLGMVFQNYALFPHMNVFENIAFGLRIRRMPQPAIQQKVQQALQLIRMEGYEHRFPGEMSGGQQQRVSLGRALAIDPQVLLLDEPFGAIDRKLRKEMQVELRDIQKELEFTAIFVTHDQEEALTLADQIAVMDAGKIVQLGSPSAIYERPRTRFVAGFMGEANFFSGSIKEIAGSLATIQTEQGWPIVGQLSDRKRTVGEKVTTFVRPEKIKLGAASSPGYPNSQVGRIQHILYLGEKIRYDVVLPTGQNVMVSDQNIQHVDAWRVLTPGQEVCVQWGAESSLILDD